MVGQHSSVVTEQFEVNSARKHIGQFLIDFCIDVHNFLIYLHVIVWSMLATMNCFRPSFQHVSKVNWPHVFDTFDIHLVTMDRPKALGEAKLEPLSTMAWQQASKH